MLKYAVPLEPIVMSLHEYHEKSLFTYEVKRTGRILYNADPDQEVKELAHDYLYLAMKWFQHSKKIHEESGEPRFSIDAAELSVKALIMLKSETLAKTYGGLLSQFGRLYTRTGEVPHEVLSKLYHALTLRNRARYDPRATLTEREAMEVIKLAEKLIEMLKSKLSWRTINLVLHDNLLPLKLLQLPL